MCVCVSLSVCVVRRLTFLVLLYFYVYDVEDTTGDSVRWITFFDYCIIGSTME